MTVRISARRPNGTVAAFTVEGDSPAELCAPDSHWVLVEASEDADHAQFCCWSCLAAWATNRAVEREAFLPEPS